MPDEIQIRNAVRGDAGAIAEIHVSAWRVAYAGILPDEYLAGLSIERHTAFWERELAGGGSITLVSVREGSITGWVSGGNSRDDDGAGVSEVYAIYISPGCWERGCGRELMTEMRRRFLRSPTTLWVLERNLRGIGFYQRLGFTPDGSSKVIRIAGTELAETRLRKEWTPEAISGSMEEP